METTFQNASVHRCYRSATYRGLRESRRLNRGLNRNLKVQYADKNVEHRVWNRPAARAAGDEQDATILRNDCRCHRADRALAGRNRVRSRADLALSVGLAGKHVE